MKHVRKTLVAAALACGPSAAALAQSSPAEAASAAASAAMTEAEVRKVDRPAGKLTLRHGEIKSLDMPPMTMVFGVKDPAMLDQVKTGDRIRFAAIREDGKFTVTEIQPAD